MTRISDGDFRFHSPDWLTQHGAARVLRNDNGASMVWGARLPTGRRVHCRRTFGIGGSVWRRRSDDGRSWVLGQLRLTPDEAHFSDGILYRRDRPVDENPFQIAMAGRPDFVKCLQDDAFAFTLNRELWVEALCTLDGRVGWNPSRGEAAETIANLRGFGETYADFKFGGPHPEPPRIDREVVVAALAAAGWRFKADDEWRRFEETATPG